MIIGGGLSGLAAAVRLASRGASVVLCEQAPRLGGRCYSYIDGKTGDVVDNGQHVLLGAYHNVLEYLDRIGTRHFLKREPLLRIPLHHPEKGFSCFAVPRVPKPFNLPAAMLKFSLLTLPERRRLLNVGLALKSRSLERDLAAISVEQWLLRLGQSQESMRSLWNPIAISVMNELPERASALLFARALKAAFLGKQSDSAILLSTVGQTELYITRAVEYLERKKARVMENCEVRGLEMESRSVSRVVLKNGKRLSTGFVICAIPYYAVARIIPAKLRDVHPFAGLRRIESSPIVSLHLWFEKDFMDTDFLGLIGRRIQWLFNRRRIMKENGKESGYISAVISAAHRFIDLPQHSLAAMALEDIRGVYPRMGDLVSSVVLKEKRATFSPTCEAGQWRPPAGTPIPNLFLAGDWTDTGLPATIEGAVMSGFTAADSIQ